MDKTVFINKSRKIHNNFYDYSLVEYKNMNTKVKIICPIHGVFETRPYHHLNGSICRKCSNENRKDNRESFIKKSIKKHGDKYDYSLVEYKKSQFKVKIICPIHGVFEQSPNNHIKGIGCPKCSGNGILTTEEFIERSNKVHKNKYDYSLTIYDRSYKDVKIICPEHGVFNQKPNNHLSGSGCPMCNGGVKLNKQYFIKKSKEIHTKYDYSLVDYKNMRTDVKIICPIHGVFEQRPSHHIDGVGCPFCKESKGEKEIEKFLLEKEIEYTRQKKFDKCFNKRKLPFDFYLPEFDMCIEYDGRQHFISIDYFGGVEHLEQVKVNDNIKTTFCHENNIKLLRIKYDENIFEKLNQNFEV